MKNSTTTKRESQSLLRRPTLLATEGLTEMPEYGSEDQFEAGMHDLLRSVEHALEAVEDSLTMASMAFTEEERRDIAGLVEADGLRRRMEARRDLGMDVGRMLRNLHHHI